MPGVRDGSGRRNLAEALHLPCFRKHRSHTDGVTQDALGRSTSQAPKIDQTRMKQKLFYWYAQVSFKFEKNKI